ncbi:hypothetical protein BH11PLA2_BH11PLA2_12970 [soil metagenome]
MIRFQGVEPFPIPPDQLFAKLTDATFLVKSLPDAEIESATMDKAVWKMAPKLAFISGKLETSLTVIERSPVSQAKYSILGKAVGASSTVEAILNFEPTDIGTTINWTGEITALTGLLKLVPKGLIQSAAEKVIADVWASVRASV